MGQLSGKIWKSRVHGHKWCNAQNWNVSAIFFICRHYVGSASVRLTYSWFQKLQAWVTWRKIMAITRVHIIRGHHFLDQSKLVDLCDFLLVNNMIPRRLAPFPRNRGVLVKFSLSTEECLSLTQSFDVNLWIQNYEIRPQETRYIVLWYDCKACFDYLERLGVDSRMWRTYVHSRIVNAAFNCVERQNKHY